MPKEPLQKITYFGKVSNPTPPLLAKITKGLRYFSVSLITMVSATDLFTGGQAKLINFSLGVFVLLLGTIDIVIGIESPEQQEQHEREEREQEEQQDKEKD